MVLGCSDGRSAPEGDVRRRPLARLTRRKLWTEGLKRRVTER